MRIRHSVRGVIAALGVTGLLAAGTAAYAGEPETVVAKRGVCTGESHVKLVLAEHDRRIGVRLKLTSDVAGETWGVKIVHNRQLIFKGRRMTNEDGWFGVRVAARNTEGIDYFRAKAWNPDTGEVCRVRAGI